MNAHHHQHPQQSSNSHTSLVYQQQQPQHQQTQTQQQQTQQQTNGHTHSISLQQHHQTQDFTKGRPSRQSNQSANSLANLSQNWQKGQFQSFQGYSQSSMQNQVVSQNSQLQTQNQEVTGTTSAQNYGTRNGVTQGIKLHSNQIMPVSSSNGHKTTLTGIRNQSPMNVDISLQQKNLHILGNPSSHQSQNSKYVSSNGAIQNGSQTQNLSIIKSSSFTGQTPQFTQKQSLMHTISHMNIKAEEKTPSAIVQLKLQAKNYHNSGAQNSGKGNTSGSSYSNLHQSISDHSKTLNPSKNNSLHQPRGDMPPPSNQLQPEKMHETRDMREHEASGKSIDEGTTLHYKTSGNARIIRYQPSNSFTSQQRQINSITSQQNANQNQSRQMQVHTPQHQKEVASTPIISASSNPKHLTILRDHQYSNSQSRSNKDLPTHQQQSSQQSKNSFSTTNLKGGLFTTKHGGLADYKKSVNLVSHIAQQTMSTKNTSKHAPSASGHSGLLSHQKISSVVKASGKPPTSSSSAQVNVLGSSNASNSDNYHLTKINQIPPSGKGDKNSGAQNGSNHRGSMTRQSTSSVVLHNQNGINLSTTINQGFRKPMINQLKQTISNLQSIKSGEEKKKPSSKHHSIANGARSSSHSHLQQRPNTQGNPSNKSTLLVTPSTPSLYGMTASTPGQQSSTGMQGFHQTMAKSINPRSSSAHAKPDKPSEPGKDHKESREFKEIQKMSHMSKNLPQSHSNIPLPTNSSSVKRSSESAVSQNHHKEQQHQEAQSNSKTGSTSQQFGESRSKKINGYEASKKQINQISAATTINQVSSSTPTASSSTKLSHGLPLSNPSAHRNKHLQPQHSDSLNQKPDIANKSQVQQNIPDAHQSNPHHHHHAQQQQPQSNTLIRKAKSANRPDAPASTTSASTPTIPTESLSGKNTTGMQPGRAGAGEEHQRFNYHRGISHQKITDRPSSASAGQTFIGKQQNLRELFEKNWQSVNVTNKVDPNSGEATQIKSLTILDTNAMVHEEVQEQQILPLAPGIRIIIPNHEPTKCSNKRNGIVRAYAANTNQGLVRNYNEDRVSIILNIVKPEHRKSEVWPTCSFFGVYDGHGGSACAEFLRDNLHHFVIKEDKFPWDPESAIRTGFAKAEARFLDMCQVKDEVTGQMQVIERSGSCAIVVLIVGDICYTANVGDSRAVLSSGGGQEVIALSRDHKPSDTQEYQRIIKAGGQVYQTTTASGLPNLKDQQNNSSGTVNPEFIVGPIRVLPGRLSVCRTFGDPEAKLEYRGGNPNVVKAEPEVKTFQISKMHDFIVLASDGIFDKLTDEDIGKAVWLTCDAAKQAKLNQSKRTGSQQHLEIPNISVHQYCGLGVEGILKNSLMRQSLDNVTVVMVAFSNFKKIVCDSQQKGVLTRDASYDSRRLQDKYNQSQEKENSLKPSGESQNINKQKESLNLMNKKSMVARSQQQLPPNAQERNPEIERKNSDINWKNRRNSQEAGQELNQDFSRNEKYSLHNGDKIKTEMSNKDKLSSNLNKPPISNIQNQGHSPSHQQHSSQKLLSQPSYMPSYIPSSQTQQQEPANNQSSKHAQVRSSSNGPPQSIPTNTRQVSLKDLNMYKNPTNNIPPTYQQHQQYQEEGGGGQHHAQYQPIHNTPASLQSRYTNQQQVHSQQHQSTSAIHPKSNNGNSLYQNQYERDSQHGNQHQQQYIAPSQHAQIPATSTATPQMLPTSTPLIGNNPAHYSHHHLNHHQQQNHAYPVVSANSEGEKGQTAPKLVTSSGGAVAGITLQHNNHYSAPIGGAAFYKATGVTSAPSTEDQSI